VPTNYPDIEPYRATALGAAEAWAIERPVVNPAMLRSGDAWEPLPHQVPPKGDWFGWLMLAGRGAGKTDACADWVTKHVKGPPCLPGRQPHRLAIVGPTLGDVVAACVTGPSGLIAHDLSARLNPSSPEGTVVRWDNGSYAKLFGAQSEEDVQRLRAGGNTCAAWMEELAAMRWMDAAYDQMLFGLRIGPDPRWVASTTPKPRQLIKELEKKGEAGRDKIALTRATTDDNPHLRAHIRAALFDRYGGRAIGQQELYGRIVDQDESALWRREDLQLYRVMDDPAELRQTLRRLTVGVDPSGGAGEQGIVVAGTRNEPRLGEPDSRRGVLIAHGFVLADYTCHLSPDGWGRRVIEATVDWEADDVVVETNFGGDMAVATIQGAAEQMGVPIPIRTVRASRGKRPRAEPVSALSTSGRWHHVGVFPQLEDQLCTWTPEADYSPDRLDAMVWTAWHMKLVSTASIGTGSMGNVARERVPPGVRRTTGGNLLGQPIVRPR
jgi:phage terminase large subunit-like protein